MNFSFEKLKEVLKPIEKVKLTLLIISMVLGAMLELIGIGVIMLFVSIAINIEVVLENERIKPVLDFLSIDTPKEALIYGSFLLLLIFFLKNSYIIFHQYLKSRFVYNRYKFISNRLFSLYMKSPYYFHLKRNSADLIRNISIEAENLANRVIMPFLQIIAEGILVISIALMLFIIEPFITIFSIIFLGGVSLIFLKFIKKGVKNYGKKSFEERRKMIKVISEGIGGFKEISVLKRENWFINKMKINSDILSKSQIFQQVIERSVRPTMETIAVFGMLLVSFFLLQGDRVIASLLPILVLFAFSVYRFLPALNNIINDYVRIKYHFRTIETIYDDLVTEEKKEDTKEREYNFKKEIIFENVSYSYPGGGIESLKNISFSIKRGSAVGIIGQTGSGKTTLIDIITGLLLPTKGEIKIDGISLEEMKRSFQKNIGYIPQSIYLSDDTIRNNIAFGLEEKDIDESKIEKAVKTAFVDEFSNSLPDGLNTIVGERGVRLSGGQKQRIGIARALYRDPEILIMDEATSSLDGITEKYVIKAIEELKKDRTIIMIAHRLTTIKECDIIYILKEGEIINSGSYNSLLKKSDYFRLVAR